MHTHYVANLDTFVGAMTMRRAFTRIFIDLAPVLPLRAEIADKQVCVFETTGLIRAHVMRITAQKIG